MTKEYTMKKVGKILFLYLSRFSHNAYIILEDTWPSILLRVRDIENVPNNRTNLNCIESLCETNKQTKSVNNDTSI